MADRELLRRIPKIDVLLAQDALARLCDTMPYEQVRSFARSWVDDLRADVLAGRAQSVPDAARAAEDVASRLSRRGRFHLKRVVNATGIVLHTNLGRAPLGEAVSNHVAQVARGYCNLEYNLEQGRRGSRYAHVEELICELTGAEAACVVNNNAGAVFLVLDTLCKGEAVAISRGELVEIGGSFRVPDIMARSGARLIEVGTTNKTHVRDYEDAIRDGGATTLLKVHTSNFVMRGFTESVSVPELARIAAAQDPRPLVIYDAGAALLVPPVSVGIPSALSVRAALEEGADVVSFSGDKLVGSAQAGIIVGRRDLVEKIKRNQLCRMLRVDKALSRGPGDDVPDLSEPRARNRGGPDAAHALAWAPGVPRARRARARVPGGGVSRGVVRRGRGKGRGGRRLAPGRGASGRGAVASRRRPFGRRA